MPQPCFEFSAPNPQPSWIFRCQSPLPTWIASTVGAALRGRPSLDHRRKIPEEGRPRSAAPTVDVIQLAHQRPTGIDAIQPAHQRPTGIDPIQPDHQRPNRTKGDQKNGCGFSFNNLICALRNELAGDLVLASSE